MVKIFKFGGASVKDAASVKNVGRILELYKHEKIVVVLSAMGKTTNALEVIHEKRFLKQEFKTELLALRDFHLNIAQELLGHIPEKLDPIMDQFESLNEILASPCSQQYDMEYDQIVCYGELISTTIVHIYLQHLGYSSAWLDSRQIVRTDGRHRDARVNWPMSSSAAERLLPPLLEKKDIILVQGFIGSTIQGISTTLGREGSDFTAAIMAYLLDAESVTIWKDVPGMLNADPKWFNDTVKLDRISFREAIELAYYGASVIHPKTIKPLQNKGIPLFIKSFLDPKASGTIIQEGMEQDSLVPNYIFKGDQVLVSITPKDFSFVVEDNLKEIFELLSNLGIRISLMENSAISFSIVTDKEPFKLEKLFEALRTNYTIRYNENLTLITIRHWDEKTINMLTSDREILLEHRSRQTIRMVVR